MIDQPSFSIIIPTYNRAELLPKAIDSVLSQSYEKWELIIVDDGSQDNTEKVVAPYHLDNRIYYYKTENSGAADSRNFGVSKSKNPWIAFLDSDDYWLKNKLKVYAEKINSQGSRIYFGEFFNNNEHPLNLVKICNKLNKSLYIKNSIAALSNVVMPKDIFIKAGGFDSTFESRQDIDLYVRCSQLLNLYCINKPTCVIITESNNRISDNILKRLNGSISFYEKHKSHMTFKERSINAKRILYFQIKAKRWRIEYLILSLPAILFKWS